MAKLLKTSQRNTVGRKEYTYTANIGLIKSNTSVTSSIQIKVDTNFIWRKSVASAFIAIDTPNFGTDSLRGLHFPALFVLMTENITEQKMSDIATPMMCCFGTGQQPFILTNPKVLEGNSVLSLQVSNRYAAEAVFVHLSFIGISVPISEWGAGQ